MKTESLLKKNGRSLKAAPTIPGTAGIDRKRLKTIQRQAKENRERLLDLEPSNERKKIYEPANHRSVKKIDRT